jgi:predicted porin
MQIQKKIIVLAIASALTAPALAFAEATVYGQANMSVDMVNDGAVANSSSTNQLNSNTSRLGVKGSEDLGGGLSAVWQMEAGVGVDDGTMGSAGKVTSTTTATGTTASTAVYTTKSTSTAPRVFNRNTFVGLKSDSLGTVIVGQNDTPYKTSTRRMDVFGDGIADNRGNQSSGGSAFGTTMMGAGHDTRLSNVIAYMSPSMSGMSVAAATVFGAETAAANTTKGTALSLAGMYEQGPIYATLAYQSVKAGSAGTGDLAAGALGTVSVDDKNTAIKAGVSYTMDQFQGNLVLEQHTLTLSGVENKGTNVYLSGKFNVSSSDAVKAAFTKRGETQIAGVAQHNDATQFSIGYDHNMSKATTVYALYSKVSANGALSDPSVLSAGLKHSF